MTTYLGNRCNIVAERSVNGLKLFSSDNRRLLGETDGVDILLGQLAPFKRHDPSSAQETEMMENLFNALCSALLFNNNRAKFLKVLPDLEWMEIG